MNDEVFLFMSLEFMFSCKAIYLEEIKWCAQFQCRDVIVVSYKKRHLLDTINVKIYLEISENVEV